MYTLKPHQILYKIYFSDYKMNADEKNQLKVICNTISWKILNFKGTIKIGGTNAFTF